MLFYKCQGEKKKNRDKNSLQTTFKRIIIDKNKTQDGGGVDTENGVEWQAHKEECILRLWYGGTRTQNKLLDTDISSATSSHIFLTMDNLQKKD